MFLVVLAEVLVSAKYVPYGEISYAPFANQRIQLGKRLKRDKLNYRILLLTDKNLTHETLTAAIKPHDPQHHKYSTPLFPEPVYRLRWWIWWRLLNKTQPVKPLFPIEENKTKY